MISKLEKFGLTDLQKLDSTIAVDLRYATSQNFVGEALYPRELRRAYLEGATARAVAAANQYLGTLLPGYHFVVWDAARPISVQKRMFGAVRGTEMEKYVANPYGDFEGGFHNYGLAVDLTIADADGRLLDMGTPFDSFEPTAHPYFERSFVETGQMTLEAYSNRMLLYHVTGKFGLLPHPFEWWHYQLVQSETEKTKYPLINF